MKQNGHTILVKQNAGVGIGCEDASVTASDAEVVDIVQEIFSRTEMVMHGKEPLPS